MSTDTASFQLQARFPVPAARVFQAWLDAAEHGAMTGGVATSDPRLGGRYTAWDGYIEGTHLTIDPDQHLVQSWRSSEFPPDAPDSRLDLTFTEVDGGCELMLVHSGIPIGQGASYAQGWEDHYFVPMLAYFSATPEPS